MSARVGWLVQELEQENSSLHQELKSIQEERDVLQREVAEQRRLLQSCVEEVFSLKEELSQLLTSLGPPAAAERQQQLCDRLARHVSEIEREVAEKGARADEWREERERREAELVELKRQLEKERQEGGRLRDQLQLARSAAEEQAAESRSKITELEETVDHITKLKATVEANHAKEVEALKKTVKDAEESVRTASSGQQQLLAARGEQEWLMRQLAAVRSRLAERDSKLADSTRQLAEAARSAEVKAAQVAGLKSALNDSKTRTTQLQKDLDEKSKQVETQAAAISKKDDLIKRQRVKLESVAKDLNKLKSVFSDSELPGLCECNEEAIGGSLRDLRALRGGRPPPACPAKQLRATIVHQRTQLENAQARVRELETSLDDLRQKLPQMSAEADRAYVELQTKLQEQQAAAARAEGQHREQQRRSQQLVLKLAAETRRLRDSEQLVQRLQLENRSLVTDRVQWERTSSKLQSALHDTVQLTARLQAARAELEAERRLTGQMTQKIHQADAQMKSQLREVMEELHRLRRAADSQPAPQVDWPARYQQLLDRCQEWQEECLARQKDCITMEQRLDMLAKQDRAANEKTPQAEGTPVSTSATPVTDETQLARLERQLQTLLSAVTRVTVTDPAGQTRAPVRAARSVPEVPVHGSSGSGSGSGARSDRRWSGPADTSSGSIVTPAEGLTRGMDRVRETSHSYSTLTADGRRPRSSPTGGRAAPSPQMAAPSAIQAAPSSIVQAAQPSAIQTAPPSTIQAALPSSHQVSLQSARSGLTSAGSVAVPELSPLLHRVTEILSEVERQRDQLTAQGHILQEYRSQARGWSALPQQQPAEPQPVAVGQPDAEDEEPCRDGDHPIHTTARRAEAGGDDGLSQPAHTAQDAQTQATVPDRTGAVAEADLPAPPAAPHPPSEPPSHPRRHRSSSRRRDQERLERLDHFRALQELLNKMADSSGSPNSGCLTSDVTVPDLTELRAQWRHLETMVRHEAQSARTRSDVVLRLSGVSDSSQ